MAQGRNTPSSSKSRRTERISATSNGVVNLFSSSTISNYAGLISNGIVEAYQNDPERMYVTERPALEVFDEAVNGSGGTKGRGIHYWGSQGVNYFMNDNIIYRANYAGACSVQGGDTAITSGSDKVYFKEWTSANSEYLFIIDPENDGIYVINDDANTTVINLVDRSGSGTLEGFTAGDGWDFDAINAIIASDGLCHGAVDLDTYLFLGTKTSARVYNSNVDDWLNWNALNFITCERSNDQLLFIEKTQDHIACFGERTIELLYDNSNATGSPLSVRTDIAHRVGVAFGQSAWTNGDDIHFLGVLDGGEFVMATLRNFQVVPHPNPTLSAYIWQSRYKSNLDLIMNGFSVGGHVYAILSSFSSGTAVKSIVYDYSRDVFYEWSTTLGTSTQFVIMGYAQRTAMDANRPAGILRNGDIFRIDTNFVPIDEIIDVGAEETENITMVITTDNYDAGATETKFMHSCSYVGNQPTAAVNLNVAWTDNDGVSSQNRDIDLAARTQINRMGKFVKRKFTFTYAGAEQIRFEGIDVTFSPGTN